MSIIGQLVTVPGNGPIHRGGHARSVEDRVRDSVLLLYSRKRRRLEHSDAERDDDSRDRATTVQAAVMRALVLLWGQGRLVEETLQLTVISERPRRLQARWS